MCAHPQEEQHGRCQDSASQKTARRSRRGCGALRGNGVQGMLGDGHLRVDHGSGGQNLAEIAASHLGTRLQDGQVVVGVQFEVGLHQVLAIGNDIIAEVPQDHHVWAVHWNY